MWAVVSRGLLAVLLVNVGVGIVSGTVFVFEGLYALYRGGSDLRIFGGASVFYAYAALWYGWRRMLKKYYRPRSNDDESQGALSETGSLVVVLADFAVTRAEGFGVAEGGKGCAIAGTPVRF